MKAIKYCLLLIALLVTNMTWADDDYEKYAKEVRASVWAWDKPAFKNYTVPDKYKNESAVIMAMHREVYATGSSKVRFDPNYWLRVNKELNYKFLLRRMIKINDKKALEDNAEVEFTEQEKTRGFYVSTRQKMIVGIRVIKPNGTIKEVDIDEAVAVTEGKSDKEVGKKLAVSDLEVGDILDVFFQEEGRIDYQNIPEQVFYLKADYPILSYSVHCELSKKLTSEYRLLNGAPDFTQTTNEEGDYVLDMKQTDIPKSTVDQWLVPIRQYPAICLSVLYNSNKKIFSPKSARDNGLYKNLPIEKVLEDAQNVYNLSIVSYFYKIANRKIQMYQKEHPNTDKRQLAEYISNVLGAVVTTQFYDYGARRYVYTLSMLFNKFEIEHKVGLATRNFGVRFDDVTAYTDYAPVIVANGDQLFSWRKGFQIEESYFHEGETIFLATPSKKGQIDLLNTSKRIQMQLPASTAEQNSNKTEMKVRLSADNLLVLDVNRRVALSGHQRNGMYAALMSRTAWADTLDRWLDEKAFLKAQAKKEKNKDKGEGKLKLKLKEQEDNVKAEIKNYHDIEVKELKGYAFPSMGVLPGQQQLIYNVDYTFEGLVRRAGNNYILDAGKLIGSQVTLDENNRNRTLDIYMPYARNYEHEIKVEIPAGYTAENVSLLNFRVDNECGTFSSSAAIEGNVLIIKARKTYKHSFEPVANWSKLVEVIDAANEFYGRSVVLKAGG